MNTPLQVIFGARAQLVVGVVLMLATVVETYYWLEVSTPSKLAIFIVSMEALAFASFNQICSALGFKATERVPEKVVEEIKQADEVNIEADEVNVDQ